MNEADNNSPSTSPANAPIVHFVDFDEDSDNDDDDGYCSGSLSQTLNRRHRTKSPSKRRREFR